MSAKPARADAASAMSCQCGDSYCEDTFGRATAGQDRSNCCQSCGYFDCDVCGWADPSGRTFTDHLISLNGGTR